MNKNKATTSSKVGSGKEKEFSLETQCSFHSKEMAEKIKAVVEHFGISQKTQEEYDNGWRDLISKAGSFHEKAYCLVPELYKKFVKFNEVTNSAEISRWADIEVEAFSTTILSAREKYSIYYSSLWNEKGKDSWLDEKRLIDIVLTEYEKEKSDYDAVKLLMSIDSEKYRSLAKQWVDSWEKNGAYDFDCFYKLLAYFYNENKTVKSFFNNSQNDQNSYHITYHIMSALLNQKNTVARRFFVNDFLEYNEIYKKKIPEYDDFIFDYDIKVLTKQQIELLMPSPLLSFTKNYCKKMFEEYSKRCFNLNHYILLAIQMEWFDLLALLDKNSLYQFRLWMGSALSNDKEICAKWLAENVVFDANFDDKLFFARDFLETESLNPEDILILSKINQKELGKKVIAKAISSFQKDHIFSQDLWQLKGALAIAWQRVAK